MMSVREKSLFLSIFALLCVAAFVFGVAFSTEVSYADGDITVSVQPEDTEVFYGDSAVLTAEGTTPASEPVEYAWYKVGAEIIVGANKTLTLTEINQSGRYFCRLSAEIGGTPKLVDTSVVTVTISPKPVKIAVSSPSSEYGEAIVNISYDLASGETLAYGDTIDDLHVSVSKSAGTDAGRYAISGTFDNANYAVTFLPATYTITPRLIEGRLVGTENLVYTGATPTVTAELMGVPEGETVNPVLSFNKALKNAGEYIAYLRTDNVNYAVSTEEINFSIQKAPLIISIDETILRVGGEVKPNYSYRGLVNGETEEVLDVKPTVGMNTDRAGVFEVTPYGATAKNYEISYLPGTVQVNLSTIKTDNLTAEGSFSYDGNAALTAKENLALNINKLNVYSVELSGTEADGEYTVTVTGIKKYPAIFLRGAVVDSEGVRHGAIKYGYNGKDFVYTADVTGTFVLYYDLTVPAIILVVLFLLMIILLAVRRKDKKRYKRLRNRQYVAQQYADRCRVRDEEE